MTTTPDTAAFLTDAITDAKAQLGRVDTKASMLLAGAFTALSVGAAALAKSHLGTLPLIGALVTLALTGTAVALLISAVRPALAGRHGFVRWATAPSIGALLADLPTTERDMAAYQANQLLSLSRSVNRKYLLVRHAVDLLRLALAIAALTALLTLTLS